eukprot:g3623.t1
MSTETNSFTNDGMNCSFQERRKRMRPPEAPTQFRSDNRSPTVHREANEKRIVLCYLQLTLKYVFFAELEVCAAVPADRTVASEIRAARSKRAKLAKSRQDIFRFPILETRTTRKPQWFQNAKFASVKKPKFSTRPPPLPTDTQLDQPVHCWAEDLIEKYSGKRSVKKNVPDGFAEAERLFAILEKRFYSEEIKCQEQDVFYDAKEQFSDEEIDHSANSESVSASSAIPEQQSSPVRSEGIPEVPLRRSRRTRKTKHAVCIGCEICNPTIKRKHTRYALSNSDQLNCRTMAAATASTPLLGGKGGEHKGLCDRLQDWFCANPRDNAMILCFLAGGFFCLLVPLMGLAVWIIPILGGIVVFGAANRVWALRNLAAEIDRFSAENERLEAAQAKLNGEVEFLSVKNKELTGNVGRLEGTVSDLSGVNEGLHNELDQFKSLKGNIEKFAAETGADVKNVLGEANKIHNKLEITTRQSERALLGKIAQDLEFLDNEAGMNKEEFDNFLNRIPERLLNKFHSKGLTFEKVAGEDNIVDFTEVEQLINDLMDENDQKIQSLSS